MDTFQQIRVRQPHPCRLHGPNPAQPLQLIKVFGNISEMEVSRSRDARNFCEIFQTTSGALEVPVLYFESPRREHISQDELKHHAAAMLENGVKQVKSSTMPAAWFHTPTTQPAFLKLQPWNGRGM
ncbi:hypothetical protein KOW79_012436 [Hemibagrus wyckioides]|uniref:Uncharacterized protein n=1 Tax=Hemibagrus wyckioides TaxID=337641 RepID=A0A9D3NNW6_9TELE|nr:hypothetical protein KOW79_012436 [Hemibagrus wyckioides]